MTVEIDYKLQKEDVLKAMKVSGYYKTVGKRRIIENILLGIFAVVFGYSYFTSGDIFNLVLAITCVVFIVVIIVVPNTDMAYKSAKLAENKSFKMRVTPQKITVNDGEEQWAIPLDGTSRCKVVENKFIAVMTPQKQLVVLPVDAIPSDVSEQVQTMIFEGTEAY